MDIFFLDESTKHSYSKEIFKILEAGDKEFLPPLSTRSSTTQCAFEISSSNADGIRRYFEVLMQQQILVAVEDGVLLGFVSFNEDYMNQVIDKTQIPNIYISTLIVSPISRGKGLTKQLYNVLFSHYVNVNIFTRTWSTNNAHIKILRNFGFNEFAVLNNDRGNGIHTIYFKKSAIA